MTIGQDRALAARLLCVGFAGPTVDEDLQEMLAAGVGGVVLFSRNATSKDGAATLVAQVKREAARAGNPGVFAAIDHEGGRVMRLSSGMTQVESMRQAGEQGSERARAIGALFASELRQARIDLDFAPVVDVDTNPANPVIGARAFSSDHETVGACAAAFIAGMQGSGVAACAKHFPGHGDTHLDSHHDLPHVSHDLGRLRRVEFPPFAAAIKAGVASIMTAHIVFDAIDAGVPATMSEKWITGVLRREMGYDGVVFSDDLEMAAIADRTGVGEAAVRSIKAGVDCLLICHRADRQREAIDALARALGDGTLPRDRAHQAAVRIDLLRAKYSR